MMADQTKPVHNSCPLKFHILKKMSCFKWRFSSYQCVHSRFSKIQREMMKDLKTSQRRLTKQSQQWLKVRGQTTQTERCQIDLVGQRLRYSERRDHQVSDWVCNSCLSACQQNREAAATQTYVLRSLFNVKDN